MRSDEIERDFYRPFWESQRELARYPAPTLAAALFKAAMIAAEDVWNDSDMTEDCAKLLHADFARLVPAREA